jgi:hypothetical protein
MQQQRHFIRLWAGISADCLIAFILYRVGFQEKRSRSVRVCLHGLEILIQDIRWPGSHLNRAFSECKSRILPLHQAAPPLRQQRKEVEKGHWTLDRYFDANFGRKPKCETCSTRLVLCTSPAFAVGPGKTMGIFNQVGLSQNSPYARHPEIHEPYNQSLSALLLCWKINSDLFHRILFRTLCYKPEGRGAVSRWGAYFQFT